MIFFQLQDGTFLDIIIVAVVVAEAKKTPIDLIYLKFFPKVWFIEALYNVSPILA